MKPLAEAEQLDVYGRLRKLSEIKNYSLSRLENFLSIDQLELIWDTLLELSTRNSEFYQRLLAFAEAQACMTTASSSKSQDHSAETPSYQSTKLSNWSPPAPTYEPKYIFNSYSLQDSEKKHCKRCEEIRSQQELSNSKFPIACWHTEENVEPGLPSPQGYKDFFDLWSENMAKAISSFVETMGPETASSSLTDGSNRLQEKPE
jgi:hypothetical protein